jgi:D-glycero-alpha-D-manno-heptose-7-phosphate kinase
LGLIFATAAYFGEGGFQITIDSESPPRSALGGSSVAAVALIAALSTTGGTNTVSRRNIALLAHAIESSVAGVPCGVQDQLAAVYGGVNLWTWKGWGQGPCFRKLTLVRKKKYSSFEKHLLLAFCGRTHESAKVNRKWVKQFLSGKYRKQWVEIITCTQGCADAIISGDLARAAGWMSKETAIRRQMTPEVLDTVGNKLVSEALTCNCGARFAGAGGGGCIWALGRAEDINNLRARWQQVLAAVPSARLLRTEIDSQGVSVKYS